MEEIVVITGIDKIKLLFELWKQSKSGFWMHHILEYQELPDSHFDWKSAPKAIDKGFIDFYCSKPIKTDLRENIAKSWLYNKYAGEGTFQEIIEKLSKLKNL